MSGDGISHGMLQKQSVAGPWRSVQGLELELGYFSIVMNHDWLMDE